MDEKRKKRSNSQVARQGSSKIPSEQESVYLLWHTDSLGDEKLIGVYEKRADASSAINRIKQKPGFSEKGGAFEIASYQLNKEHWTDGFAKHDDFSLPAWFRPEE